MNSIQQNKVILTCKDDQNVKGETTIPECMASEIVVEFRPGSNYNGTFGFDWLRVGGGDSSINDHINYADITGTYPSNDHYNTMNKNPNLFETEIKPHYVNGRFTHPLDSNQNYYVPVMSLLPSNTANISLNITFQNIPNTLKLEYDQSIFKINVSNDDLLNQLSQPINPGSTHELQITISCSTFNTIEYIDAKVNDSVVGRLKVIPNSSNYRNNVELAIIPVRTKLPIPQNALSFLIPVAKTGKLSNDEKSTLQNLLNQFYTSVQIFDSTDYLLDLSSDTIFNKDYALFNYDSQKNEPFIDNIFDIDKKRINSTSTKKSLIQYLNHLSSQQNPENNNRKKVYIFDQDGYYSYKNSPYTDIYGYSSSTTDSVVIYKGRNRFILTHELLHNLGLPHSFDNNGAFTLEKRKTLNIMDYSYKDGKNVHFSWQWQWAEINPSLAPFIQPNSNTSV